TRSVVPPKLKSVVYTPGDVCVMLLLMPPAEVTEAVSPVALKVWTRDSAASNRVQPAGFLSGTTRNSMGVLEGVVVGIKGCGADACCVVHPAMTALAMASAKNVPVKLRIATSLSNVVCINDRRTTPAPLSAMSHASGLVSQSLTT